VSEKKIVNEKKIGTVSGKAEIVEPVTIEGGEFTIKRLVAGESKDWPAKVTNNSGVEYQIRYNVTGKVVPPEFTQLVKFQPYVDGQKYHHPEGIPTLWVPLKPYSEQDILVKITVLPECPSGKSAEFECDIWSGEEELTE